MTVVCRKPRLSGSSNATARFIKRPPGNHRYVLLEHTTGIRSARNSLSPSFEFFFVPGTQSSYDAADHLAATSSLQGFGNIMTKGTGPRVHDCSLSQPSRRSPTTSLLTLAHHTPLPGVPGGGVSFPPLVRNCALTGAAYRASTTVVTNVTGLGAN
jgi:hypothetical protein